MDPHQYAGLRIRILHFPSTAFIMPTKSFLLGTLTSVFRDNKSLRSYKTVGIKIFPNYFACGWKDPDLCPYK
jgi:hypothetical protein